MLLAVIIIYDCVVNIKKKLKLKKLLNYSILY